MNWDHIEDNWKQNSATVKEKWGRLTDDQIAEMKGKREQLETNPAGLRPCQGPDKKGHR